MAWSLIPTKLRMPTYPGAVIAGPVYLSSDKSLRSYLWSGRRVISNKYGYSIVVGGSASHNNLTYYRGGFCGFSGGTYNVWYDMQYGWVASTLPIGSPIYEYWEYTDPTDTSKGGAYKGSAFYTLGSAYGGNFPSLDATSTAYGRGSLRGTTEGAASSTTLEVSTTWQRWLSPSLSQPYGKYTAAGTASGDKYFGLPSWRLDKTVYVRSSIKSDDHWSYGEIAWDSTAEKFVLGNYGSAEGWHEAASDPSSGSSWELSFAKPEDSDATGSSLTLAWADYVLGDDDVDIYVFRVARLGAD